MRATATLRIGSLLLALALGGCAGEIAAPTLSMPSLGLTPDGPEAVKLGPGRAVGIISASIEGLQCADSRLVLARAGTGGLAAVQVIELPGTYASRPAIGVFEAEPGSYELVSYACRNGANVTYVGHAGAEDVIPWQQADGWRDSLASLSLAAGRATDLGALQIKRVGGGGGFLGKKKPAGLALDIAALPEGALGALQAERPDLAPYISAAPMALSATPPRLIGKCALTADTTDDATATADGKDKAKSKRKPKRAGKAGAFASMSGPAAVPTRCKGSSKGLEGAMEKIGEGL